MDELGTTLAVFFRRMLRLLLTANVLPSSPTLVILIMEAIRSSETSILTRAARRDSPEDDILQCPGGYSVSNRHEYESRNETCFWGVESGWSVRLTNCESPLLTISDP
jgi:hypothetical protein